MPDPLQALLSPERLTQVVDVGARLGDDDPPYTAMLAAGLCQVTGFEAQRDAFFELQAKRHDPNERYVHGAVGDGGAHTLYVSRGRGLSSLLEPDLERLGLFGVLEPLAHVLVEIPMQTHRLDDIAEIAHLDLLKIDVQGSELVVFRGGTTKLAEAVAIQAEVSFTPLYKDQPTLGDIDGELRGQGFLPHGFPAMKTWRISSPLLGDVPHFEPNQVLDADLVYVRDFGRPDEMTDEQLKQLALIAHHCYGSVDLALRCVTLLDERRALDGGAQRYVDILNGRTPTGGLEPGGNLGGASDLSEV
ncbi:FkbM family methyltransferase [Mycobacterium numidiamassiliense]|uniref:FkbM family methyltransferase n=1 Tax=Mycobacterium numidiamassiliense TaxID=1841861 RepID=UPI00097DA5FF|nr:FkbM family methyltransferase [Mycobacterium numidiamassiliense]